MHNDTEYNNNIGDNKTTTCLSQWKHTFDRHIMNKQNTIVSNKNYIVQLRDK